MSDSKNQPNEKNTIFKDEEALLLDHDYDGIQELDHPLPGWWLGILYTTIVFSIVYCGYYMTGMGPTLRDELAVALLDIEAKKPKVAADGGLTDEVIMASFKDPAKLQNGAQVYVGKCAACHGDKGQGIIGPNLTDDHWIHGQGNPASIAAVVRDGVTEKGMPPWGPVLTPDELIDVTAYIRSLHGTNPVGAKEPQGQAHEFVNL
jgi:cytochrome c oxidase cbb3-type subunit 3